MKANFVPLPVANGAQTRTALWRLLPGTQRALLGVAVLISTVAAALGLATPFVLGRIVEDLSGGGSQASAWTYGAIIASAAAASAILGSVGIFLTMRACETALAQLREAVVSRALELPVQQVESAGTGDLISRTSDDVARASDGVTEIVPALTSAMLAIAVTIAGMTVVDWRYGLVLILLVPVYALAARWYLRRAPQLYAAQRASTATLAHHLLSTMRAVDTVLAFRMSRHRLSRILGASWEAITWAMRAATIQSRFFGRLDLAYAVAVVALLIVGFAMIGAGLSTVGAATTVVLLFLRLHGSIYQLMFVMDTWQTAAASLARIVGVTTAPADMSTPPAISGDGGVEMTEVSFRYTSERPTVQDISLTIAPGERVAIVGASGAGKTTLSGILAGVHAPDTGSVRRPERTLTITQDAHVFSGTLRDNLTLAKPDATDGELAMALTAVGAGGLLDQDQGLELIVGAVGTAISPTEAQQIALARVILANPDLAIFDEATAETGSAHADELDRAAAEALRGRTSVVIAHRLSQAVSCDRIAVMEAGRIIEQGDHRSLVAANGTYARLWAAWHSANGSRASEE